VFARVTVTVDSSVLDAINEAALKSPTLMKTAFRRTLNGQKRRILSKVLDVEPGPVQYNAMSASGAPMLRWKSKRQMRAAHATGNWGAGMPYVRTGNLAHSWNVYLEDDGNGGLINIENYADYAQFVVGDWEQPFHYDTGWRNITDVLDAVEPIVELALIETWYTVTDPYGGVPE
jgi:hypothetical protein